MEIVLSKCEREDDARKAVVIHLPTTEEAIISAAKSIGLNDLPYDSYQVTALNTGENDTVDYILANGSVNLHELNFVAMLLAPMSCAEKNALDAVMQKHERYSCRNVINSMVEIRTGLREAWTDCHDFADVGKRYCAELVKDIDIPDPVWRSIDFNKLGEAYADTTGGEFVVGGYIPNGRVQYAEFYNGSNLDGIFDRWDSGDSFFNTVHYICPLKIEAHAYSSDGDMTGETVPVWDGTLYASEIVQAIEQSKMMEESERGLMEYCYTNEGFGSKVFYCYPGVKEIVGELVGDVECLIIGELTSDEQDEFTEYLTGQFSDGWGESFEQRGIKSDEGDLYVSFWQSNPEWDIMPEDEYHYAKQYGMEPSM